MIKYLSEAERTHLENFKRALKVEALDDEAKILVQMLRHDWSWSYSDSASVARSGAANEKRLKDLIETSTLPQAAKERLNRYFRIGSDSAWVELHREYGYLGMVGLTPDVLRGKVRMAFHQRYTDEQWGEFERVFADLKALGEKLSAAKCPSRLIMTDDIPPFDKLREIATRVKEEENDSFFYGMAVPAACQDELDRIVRTDKRTLVLMAQDSEVLHVLGSGSTVDMEIHQEHWLFRIQFTSAYYDMFGFFCCPHVTRPRNEWNKKPRADEGERRGKRPMNGNEMSREHQQRRQAHDRPRGSRDPEVGRVINESRRAVDEIVPRYPRGQTPHIVQYDDAPYQRSAKPAAPQVKRKIVPALSNRPLEIDAAPAKKAEKKAPQKRAKSFTKLGSLADLGSALTE